MKVLIVDDDKAMVKLLAASVEYCGHDSVTAADGEEALYVYAEESPDIVLMDIIMPVADGIEGSRRIFEYDSQAHIVFITGIGDYPEEIPAEIKARCTILTKPIGMYEILQLLETAEQARIDAAPSE